MKLRPAKIKHILSVSFFLLSVPALLLLLILTGYTIQRQMKADQADLKMTLQQIGSSMEDTLHRSEDQLTNLTALGTYFQMFHYSDTSLEKYQNAYEVTQIFRPLLTQNPVLGGFFLYSSGDGAYYYPVYQSNYPYDDQIVIKEFLTQDTHPIQERNRWIPFPLSDRTVLIRMVGYDTSICAVMIDLSLDERVSALRDPDLDTLAFYASTDGQPFTSLSDLENLCFPYENRWFETCALEGTRYQTVHAPIDGYPLQLCHKAPYRGILAHLNLFQKLLLVTIILLIVSMSLIWLFLYKKLIHPIRTLTDTMNQVGAGALSLRVSEEYPVEELENLSRTFNQMLDSIHQLKLESYEKKLDLKQAQLQYLQLQIRPHFYLNCLKGLYSMAEKRQYHEIQESVLSLSEYFRYMFRNNQELVSLSEEIHSVSSYLNLQKLYFSRCPKLTMDLSAETADLPVPPLSILTFVENSVKHCVNPSEIWIHIKALTVADGQDTYLNITVSDNCGGFSPQALEILNHLEEHDFLYKDYHVGIYNVYYRMKLMYGNQATLAFYNLEDQGCAELYLPILKGRC